MKGLSAFLFLLGISMVANAISGKWAFDRSKEDAQWVALDLAIGAAFFVVSLVVWRAAVRRQLEREYRDLARPAPTDEGRTP